MFMSKFTTGLIVTGLLVTLIAGLAQAQQADTEVLENTSEGQALTQAEWAQEVQRMRADLKSLSENFTVVTKTVAENSALVGNMRQDLDDLRASFREQLEQQQKLLETLSNSHRSNRPISPLSSIPTEENAVSSIADSADLDQDDANAAPGWETTEGEFTILNQTATERSIQVNDYRYRISAGQQLTLKVPVGTVTTQLEGESAKNWSLNAPQYAGKIEIVPSSQPAAQETVVVNRPLTAPRASVYVQPRPAYYYYYRRPLWPLWW
ncbi:MAG: hypothetical protein MK165_07100 [Pirellulaceae bacterium]|nr:hypothetical protein [Pirellulaceae bacterium]